MKKNPSYKNQIIGLKRVEGQIRGVIKMIEDGKYCIDILNQVKAAKSALVTIEANILKNHVKECVKEAISNPQDFDIKIEELTKLINK